MPKTSKSVTRVELSEAVYQTVGVSRIQSSAFVELFLKVIADTVERVPAGDRYRHAAL